MLKRPVLIAILTIILCSVIIGLGCKTPKNKQNSPESVAVRFLGHLGQFEFDDARKLGTDNTNRLIDMLEVLMQLSEEKDTNQIIQKKDIDIEVIKVAVDGNVAVITYKGEDGKMQMLDMVKEDRKWLVDLKKETPGLDALPGMNKQIGKP